MLVNYLCHGGDRRHRRDTRLQPGPGNLHSGAVGAGVRRHQRHDRQRPGLAGRRHEQAGRSISYWGVDDARNVVLAFGSRRVKPGSGSGTVDLRTILKDPHNQAAVFGLQSNDILLFS